MKMKDLCESERPREKMLASGAATLSNGELLAVIIGSGTGRMNALETAQTLLAHCDGRLSILFSQSLMKLRSFAGIGRAKACSIAAALELGRRFMAEKSSFEGLSLISPRVAFEHILPQMKGLLHEECWVMLLNKGGKLLRKERISSGSDDMTVVDTRRILQLALENNAGGIILAHNHPGGNPSPSAPDLQQTQKVHQAASQFNIELVDHLIVCDDCFYSVADDKKYKL